MSIDGRITVDALFHDKSGTARLKVLSLESSNGYTSGQVVRITGTAGTAATALTFTNYRDASGAVVSLVNTRKLAYSWSGPTPRKLDEVGIEDFRLMSKNNEVAVTNLDGTQPVLQLMAHDTTGTYTVIIWADD
jgi:hypothetical protein